MVEKRFEKLGMPDIERFENYLPTAFNSELTLLQKVNKIIFDLIETNKLTNEMVEYLNRFIESFDEKLYETLEDVLNVWLEDGLLADIVREAINDEVIEARTDYLGKKYVNLKERLDSEKAENAKKIKDRWVSITDSPYNAIGDWDGANGTDNTVAIQTAINDAAPYTTIIIPYAKLPYKVSPNITLKSNIEIICFGTLFLPSSSSYQTLFTGGAGIQNFKANGIKLKSTNDKIRVVGRSGLGSNVFLFSLSNCTNITLKNIYGENLEYLIKVDANSSNFILDKIKTKNVFQPIYSVGLSLLRGKKWNFECPLTGDNRDHHLYMNGGNSDWVVDDITCTGGSGQAISIADTNTALVINKDIYFSHLRFIEVIDVIVVLAGKNIKLDHVYVNGISGGRYVLGLTSTTKLLNEDITIENFVFENIRGSLTSGSNYGVFMPKNISFKNGVIKGRIGGHAIQPFGYNMVFDDVVFEESQSTNASGRVIYVGTETYDFSLVLNNCSIVYETVTPSQEPFSIRATSNYRVTIKNSKIINKTVLYSAINYNIGNGTVLFKNNEFKGFTDIKVVTFDTQTVAYDNFNMDTNVMI